MPTRVVLLLTVRSQGPSTYVHLELDNRAPSFCPTGALIWMVSKGSRSMSYHWIIEEIYAYLSRELTQPGRLQPRSGHTSQYYRCRYLTVTPYKRGIQSSA